MFNCRVQKSGETIDHHTTDVIKLPENCQYGGPREDLIRDNWLVVRDNNVREKFLGMKDLKLHTDQTIEINQALKFQVKDRLA